MTWPYDNEHLTCKDGHRTPRTVAVAAAPLDSEPAPEITTRRIPWTALIAAGAYLPEIVRLFT